MHHLPAVTIYNKWGVRGVVWVWGGTVLEGALAPPKENERTFRVFALSTRPTGKRRLLCAAAASHRPLINVEKLPSSAWGGAPCPSAPINSLSSFSRCTCTKFNFHEKKKKKKLSIAPHRDHLLHTPELSIYLFICLFISSSSSSCLFGTSLSFEIAVSPWHPPFHLQSKQ